MTTYLLKMGCLALLLTCSLIACGGAENDGPAHQSETENTIKR